MINGHVEFSAANYGNSIIIMILCGVAGTLGTISMSQVIHSSTILLTIGANTGIIWGLHSMVQASLRYALLYILGIPLSGYPIFFALVVVGITLLILYPVIQIFNKYTPKLIGK